jgi:hypothetical protein
MKATRTRSNLVKNRLHWPARSGGFVAPEATRRLRQRDDLFRPANEWESLRRRGSHVEIGEVLQRFVTLILWMLAIVAAILLLTQIAG